MSEVTFRPPRDPFVPPGGIEIFQRDMTVTVAADVPLAEVQRRLAEVDQWLPIDGDPAQPVGRLVEMNSTGPLRLGYGAWRDLLLGCQFRNGRGELITAGGRTVKNVAGYDLTKFLVGQGGQIGSVVTITSRTYRRPAGAIVALVPDDLNVTELLASPLRPQWIMGTLREWCVGYVGDPAYLDFCYERAGARWPGAVARRSLDEDSADRAVTFSRTYDQAVTFRASVSPASVRNFVRGIQSDRWAADLAFGIVRGNVNDDGAFAACGSAADAVGGRVWREGGGDPFGQGATAQLIARLIAGFSGTQEGRG